MNYKLDDLLYLMKRLRHPDDGCAWDLKQTPKEIINHSIEEVYELVEAIECGSIEEIKAELGDVLFQVIFLSRIFEEDGKFCFGDIIHSLCEKLINRHPHIFIGGDLYSKSNSSDLNFDADQVSKNWEKIKLNERLGKNLNDFFADIPSALPALSRSYKLQKRAASVGFEFESFQEVFLKLKEEVSELDEVLSKDDKENINNKKDKIEEELGDIFFSAVNLARSLSINPEYLVRKANKKFIKRVDTILSILSERDGINWQSSFDKISKKHLEKLWIEIKQKELNDC